MAVSSKGHFFVVIVLAAVAIVSAKSAVAIGSVNNSARAVEKVPNQPAETTGKQNSLIVGHRQTGDNLSRLVVLEESVVAWGAGTQVRNITKQITLNPNDLITRIEVTEQSTTDTEIGIIEGGVGQDEVTLAFRNPCNHVHVAISIYVKRSY